MSDRANVGSAAPTARSTGGGAPGAAGNTTRRVVVNNNAATNGLATQKKPVPPPMDTKRSTATNGLKSGKKTNRMTESKEAKMSLPERNDNAFDHDDMQPLEIRRVPEDQIKDLTPAQKSEVFTKVLTAVNPNLSKNITRFNFKERGFKLESSVDHLVVHFSMESSLMLADSAEARAQDRYYNEDKKEMGVGDSEVDGNVSSNGRALKNQFNFSERASQTFNNPMRDREVATEPPPCKEFTGSVTQWEIFDTYLEDFLKQQAAKNAKDSSKVVRTKEKDEAQSAADSKKNGKGDLLQTEAISKALQIMERMVNQNAEDETFHDYRYYEEESDFQRDDGKGQFLPLWKFQNGKAKRKTVTSMVWNPQYNDMFAVAYGSYEFSKQGSGLVCVFSLKNTSHPEYSFTTDSGVMSLDFHPQHSSLLAAGLYNGTVCVYDIRGKSNTPIYVSSDPKMKHTDPVWQVRWQEQDDPSKNLQFYSISSDGRVTNWIMSKNELSNEDVVELKQVTRTEAKEDEDTPPVGLAGGSCFDFNKRAPHLFVVGTEEGSLHLYSKAYNTQFLESFEGHHMAVYAVRWNPFHPRVFLSCSSDWTVKLWDQNSKKPLMTFDLSNAVGDVCWSPYSSTVFATITTDGKLRLYDLNVNKHEPVGETRVVKKAKLTHVCFNPKEPVVLVGDDGGAVMSFKLSPNLRKMSAPKIEDIDPKAEMEKLDKLLVVEETDEKKLPLPVHF